MSFDKQLFTLYNFSRSIPSTERPRNLDVIMFHIGISVKMVMETGTETSSSIQPVGAHLTRAQQACAQPNQTESAHLHPHEHLAENPPKQVILDAAQRLLVRNGYAGLSMRELSRTSGLAKGTIYYHFADKQAIYLNVLERDMQAVAQRIRTAAAGKGSCIDRLRCVVETYFEIVRDNCSLLMTRLREIHGMEEPLRYLVNQHRHELFQPVIDLLHEGMDAGYFRRMDAQMAVLSLFGMMNNFATHGLLLDQATITPEVVTHTLELFLCGIASDTFDAVAYLQTA